MDRRKPANRAPAPPGADQWRLDPGDVGRHARRMREAKRVGPLGKLVRYAAGALALAAGVSVYLNFDRVRALRVDASALTGLFADDADRAGPGTPRAGGEPATEVIEGGGIAGVPMPTSIGGAAPEAQADAVEPADRSPTPDAAPAPAESPSQAEPTAAERAEEQALATAPAPEPERPVTPERFHFGVSVVSVSEADASADVLVLRNGGRRGVSSVTWWTTDGTATAGSDYASLGQLVERFGVGEQNRTLRIPIVGDRNVEGPEIFYVHVAPSEAAAAAGASVERLEVIINDDD
jgi:hypothetical protein